LGGFALLGLAEALLAVSMAGIDAVGDLLTPAVLAAGAAGAILLAAAAAIFVRFPLLTIPALILAAPFRLPLDVDREHRFFFAVAEGGKLGRLIPLYVVLTAAVAAFLYRALRRNEVAAPPRLIALPAATFLGFVSISLLWTQDLDAGANLLAFFLLPFAAMTAIVARSDLAPWLPKALAVIAVGLASVFALVGLWQEMTKELLFYGPQLEVANAYSPFFRVTSLFTDPSLYGRHVVLGFAVLLVLLWARTIHVAAAAALMAVMFAGLYFSYSQSSWAALFVVAAAVTIVAGDRSARRAVAAATAVAVIVATGFIAVQARGESIRELTSGRWLRAELTIDVVRGQPVIGAGLGAQPKVSRELRAGRNAREARFVSHTTPLTVAAELGLVGFVLYALLLAAAVRMLVILRRSRPALGLGIGAVLLALFTHALAYSGFFEDPITWLALGVGAAYLAVPVAVRESEAAPTETGRVQAERVPSAR
ncbi:MAG: O-antigen ligase family protein, partial [Actinobacteria bacterium]|nr:O-antigen ligase family protein [Actinomycetota bacterium]